MCVNINKAIDVALSCVVFRKYHPFPFALGVTLVKFQGSICAGAILTKSNRTTTNQQKDEERLHDLKTALKDSIFWKHFKQRSPGSPGPQLNTLQT